MQKGKIKLGTFLKYASQRIITFGKWVLNSKSPEIKLFLKSKGAKIHGPTHNDYYEENTIWYKLI
jgi:hypothetical protein